jgi:hypothetical protein
MTLRSNFARALTVSSLGALLFASGCLPRRAYDPCVVNADCPAGTQCLTITADSDRICTSSCSTDTSCPLDRFGSNGRCISFDGGSNFSCWQACALGGGGSECPVGYDCFDSDATGRTFPPICLPSRGSSATQRPYETCTSTAQCLAATQCLGITARGDSICTDFCTTDSSCPADRFGSAARCMSFDGGGTFSCFQACNLSAGGSECPSGFGCFDNDGTSSFPPICLPR